ncbi:MAG TPA: C1 family peptidase [Thermodesulfovibrionales bacterium]|nr:C1 family peptidase [Thermodesulfovibrionales bacterium]
MYKKKLFALGVILLSVLFLISAVSFADELTDIQSAIKGKGAKWTAGETSMMKLSKEERKKRVGLILEFSPENEMSFASEEPVSVVPASLDWRNNGGDFVTPVRNQASCGSCWAFATTAAAESAWLIAQNWSGMDLNLAEQILVSCSGAGDCGGGYIGSASNYIRDTGLPEEICFPYRALDCNDSTPVCCTQACLNWTNSTHKIDSYSGVSAAVDAIKNALNTNGPLVTTMAVYNDFFSYTGGVYTHVTGSLAGYHAVLIIGYDDPGHYFIVKNSWASGWGSTAGYGTEKGYFMIDYSQMSNDVSFGASTQKYFLASTDSTIAVSTPNGSESWQAGTPQTITWSYTGNPGSSVKIDLYKGTSLNRTITSGTSAGSGGSGSYNWPIPADVIDGTDYRVNVTSTSYSSVSDMSNGYFTIVAAPPFSASGLVTSGGSGLSGLTMTFSRVSGTGTIPASVITNASGVWSQTGFQMGTAYRVTPSRAGYTFNPTYSNFSDESIGLNFIGTPVIPSGLTVVSPNGGENWKTRSSHAITWTYTGNPGSKVKIELLQNGILNRTITTKASIGSGGSGSYNWKISRSQATGTDYKITITSTTTSSATDTSNGNFSISK